MNGEVRFSIVEPYWERAAALRAQLESFRTHYASRDDWELVIVDDGSPTEPARPVVEEFSDLPIRLFEEPMRAPGDGKEPCVPMNRAVRESVGEVLVLSQADIVHVGAMLDGLYGVFGKVPENSVVYPVSFDSVGGGLQYRADPYTGFPTWDCMMLRRTLWDLLGGLDEWYRDGFACSDGDILRRFSNNGGLFVCVPNMFVLHRGDLCEQWRDKSGGEAYNRNLARMNQKCGDNPEARICCIPAGLPQLVPVVVKPHTRYVGMGSFQ